MQEVLDFIKEVISQFPEYPWWLTLATIVGIIGLTEGIKYPIKLATAKAKTEAGRQFWNASIMFIPTILAFVCGWLYTLIPYEFSAGACFSWSFTSMALYEFVARVVKRIKNGKAITNETIAEDFDEAKAQAEANTAEARAKFKEIADKITNKGE